MIFISKHKKTNQYFKGFKKLEEVYTENIHKAKKYYTDERDQKWLDTINEIYDADSYYVNFDKEIKQLRKEKLQKICTTFSKTKYFGGEFL